jgi:site-specific DNA-methyltransferase (adenine-specific)
MPKSSTRSSNQTTLIPAWQSSDRQSVLYQTDLFALAEQLEPESIDCIWTDPPYFLSNGGMTCVSGRWAPVNKGRWDKSQGLTVDHEFNRRWLALCYRLLTPAGTIWVSGTAHVYFSVGMALLESGFRLLNDIVWEKPNPPPNLGCRCFTHATELVLWATKAVKGQKPAYTFNYGAMRKANNGKQMKNVWRMGSPGRIEKTFGKHPTQKPVELIQRCLEASTNPGDLVFDPFAGSASTGVAALGLGRRFTGCELDEKFAQIAALRLADAEQSLAVTDPGDA